MLNQIISNPQAGEQDSNNLAPKILNDTSSSGRKRPWAMKKKQSQQLASVYEIAYERYGFPRYKSTASAMDQCANYLEFALPKDGKGKKKLVAAAFCQKRLCPMCSWRKSLKTFNQTSKVMDYIQEHTSDIQPAFLTLTIKNCQGEDLAKTIDDLIGTEHAWYKLTKARWWKRNVVGWMRTLEVTYNATNDNYHPHLHIILLFDKSYFKKSNEEYRTQDDWKNAWQSALDVDYEPIVDIRKVRNSKNKERNKNVGKVANEAMNLAVKKSAVSAAVAEVSKYSVKAGDYITGDAEESARIVNILDDAMFNRRLVAYGGEMKKVYATLYPRQKPDDDKADLINVDGDEEMREDVEKLIIRYRWQVGVSNYVKAKRQ